VLRAAPGVPSRGLLGLHGHLQGRGRAQRPVDLRLGAVEAVDELSGRSVLVTGGHGLLGSWLGAGLLARGARGVTIRRDEPAVSALALLGLADRVDVVPGDITSEGLVARALSEYQVTDVFHLAAQTLVGTANHAPLSTFETNVRGTWTVLEACRQHGAER